MMGVSRYSSHRAMGFLRSNLGAHTIIWMLVASFALPPSLLAQSLQSQPAVPGGLQQQPGAGVPGGIFTPGGFAAPGTSGQLGQAILTNPTALQPIVPNQVPCPIPLSSDLNSKGTVPNLNDYWPVEPSSLLPSSIEQRMKQEQEERDRRQEKLQAEKEKSSIEYQVQVEREKKGVAQLPFGQGAVPGLQPQLSQTPTQPGTNLPFSRGWAGRCRKRRRLQRSCCDSRTSMSKRPSQSFPSCTASRAAYGSSGMTFSKRRLIHFRPFRIFP